MVINNAVDIQIRAVEPEDLDFLMATENNPQYWEVSNTRIPFSRNTLRQYLETPQDIYTDKQLRLVVTLNGVNCGLVDLVEFDPFHLRVGIGIVVHQEYTNLGVATLALQKTIQFAVQHLGIRVFWCNILENNAASIHLFEKLSFQRRGNKPAWHKTNTGEFLNEYFYQLNV